MSLRRPGILFYEEDLVALKSDAGQRVATVVRTWHEDGEIDNDDELDLAENQYLVEWINKRRQTVNGHDLILRDRSFQVGDICRSTTQAQKNTISGVVANVKMEVQLQSVATATKTPDWISTTTLSKTACIEEGDHVIYKNWVGIVEIVFEEALLTVKGSNRPYKVYCVEGVQYGSPSETILDSMQGIVTGKSLGSHITRGNSKVVAIRQTVVFVTWLALNQKLPPQEEPLFPEPKALWTELEELTVIRPFEEHKYALGDSVFVIATDESVDQQTSSTSRFDEDRVQTVCNTRTFIEVLWQDGTRTWKRSTNLEQSYFEEHEILPGDHVIYRDTEEKDTAAVVQSMNASEQTVCIYVYGSEEKDTKTVSALECKIEGSPDYPFGVNRGDIVLISRSETAYVAPSVARLGKLAPSDIDEEAEEEKVIEVGRALARQSSRSQLSVQRRPRRAKAAQEIDWYGAVVDCSSNGRIIVELPNGKRIEERIEKLSSLIDGFEDGHEDDTASSNGSSWESTSNYNNNSSIDGRSFMEVDDDEVEMECDKTAAVEAEDLLADMSIAAFKLIENAPGDHAFLSQSHDIAQQKSFLSRIQREHKILSTSLPDTILVRTYEDRLDLFRAIIIGSQGTPYEDAPICIDFHLKSSYPLEPPLAYFHSWSRGLGRINPHLYEDGSVCLSLLNTWEGDSTEAWNPAKSTLLQVLISIQALVLIAEPGLETEHVEVTQQSNMQYSEKAYILSRHFIVQALQHGVRGFESDLQRVYGTMGRLSASIQKAHQLLEQDNTTASGKGAITLTKGGAIALRRVVNEMERLQLHTLSKADATT